MRRRGRQSVSQSGVCCSQKRRPPAFYSNLHRTLHTLIRFFNFGADETANVQVLEKIERLLMLHGLETADLIHCYHQERLEEQKVLEETVYGLITVKAHFIDNSLNIQILNARNLRCMDSNGERDITFPRERKGKKWAA